MKKLFVMFATVAAFTLASCGGKAEQKATENAADTAPAVEAPKTEEKAPEAKVDSNSVKKEGVQEAPKVEGAGEMKKEEAKPAAEVKKEEVKK